jgi:hypothetical protein
MDGLRSEWTEKRMCLCGLIGSVYNNFCMALEDKRNENQNVCRKCTLIIFFWIAVLPSLAPPNYFSTCASKLTSIYSLPVSN